MRSPFSFLAKLPCAMDGRKHFVIYYFSLLLQFFRNRTLHVFLYTLMVFGLANPFSFVMMMYPRAHLFERKNASLYVVQYALYICMEMCVSVHIYNLMINEQLARVYIIICVVYSTQRARRTFFLVFASTQSLNVSVFECALMFYSVEVGPRIFVHLSVCIHKCAHVLYTHTHTDIIHVSAFPECQPDL